jgi:thymidylate synthase ThyX
MVDIKPRTDITAKVIASSIHQGIRIDTLQLRYPRIIHAEFMTHRMLSKNASSSRAIPVKTMLTRDEAMFVPNFRVNQPGMQPGDNIDDALQMKAEAIWRDAALACRQAAAKLAELGVHKQWTNRPLEFFGYIDVLCTSTDWENFFWLRDHPAAQDEIFLLAQAMRDAIENYIPLSLDSEWHLPYLTAEDKEDCDKHWHNFRPQLDRVFGDNQAFRPGRFADYGMEMKLVASASRCCRVSYSKMDGTPSTLADDMDRFLKLFPESGPIHASPLEHQAWPGIFTMGSRSTAASGNFTGWTQFRKLIPTEAVREKHVGFLW